MCDINELIHMTNKRQEDEAFSSYVSIAQIEATLIALML